MRLSTFATIYSRNKYGSKYSGLSNIIHIFLGLSEFRLSSRKNFALQYCDLEIYSKALPDNLNVMPESIRFTSMKVLCLYVVWLLFCFVLLLLSMRLTLYASIYGREVGETRKNFAELRKSAFVYCRLQNCRCSALTPSARFVVCVLLNWLYYGHREYVFYTYSFCDGRARCGRIIWGKVNAQYWWVDRVVSLDRSKSHRFAPMRLILQCQKQWAIRSNFPRERKR